MTRFAAIALTAIVASGLALPAAAAGSKARHHAASGRVVKTYMPASAAAAAASDPAPVGDSSGPPLRSAAAVVFDQASRTPVYSKNDDQVMPIASLSKLMTAMVVLDAGLAMDEPVTIADEDVDTIKGSSSRLRVGLTLPRGEMLRLALMSSENRATAALARTYPGGTAAFVQQMNHKAALLGMAHTRFVEPTGLSSDNVSTAGDLVRMVEAAYRYETIRADTTTEQYEVQPEGLRRTLRFHNSNRLVGSPDWEIGLSKTGYISEAGRCLVMQARIGERPFVIVLLDSMGKLTRIGDANRIKRWLEQHLASREQGIVLAAR